MLPVRPRSRTGVFLVARPDESQRAIVVACAVLAFVARLARAGGIPGLWAYGGYDDGVYFAAADAFVHGRVPYRDFLLLHPPGIVLALAPFAELTHWTPDAQALVMARVAWMVLGAVNTALVVRVAGAGGRRSALTAGLLYALLPVATGAEYLTMLEPLGTTAVLAAVLLARRAERAGASGWWSFGSGAAVAMAPMTKIWGVVVVGVVLAWHAWRLGPRSALRAASGAFAAALVVMGPFAVLAGGKFWRDVVVDQLGRPRAPVSAAARLAGLTGTSTSALPGAAVVALAGVVSVALIGCSIITWRARRGRLWVVLLGVQVAVLVLSPSYFTHYAALAAPSLVLVVASAVASAPRLSRASIAVAACAGLACATVSALSPSAVPFPAQTVRALLPTAGCVRSDSPGALVLLDLLSRELKSGCTVLVDLSGISYDRRGRSATGPVSRRSNRLYQEEAVDYLASGSSAVLVRGLGDGFSGGTVQKILAGRQLERVGGYVRVLTLPGGVLHDPAG
ncbi:hypothetical protein [Xylanimonas sp. McL0601]|uniref:hypothetical protein n=1 Tax=Xylanimonas sp. McL0601 TaxID=3414739 RepID=UPI003CF8B6AB